MDRPQPPQPFAVGDVVNLVVGVVHLMHITEARAVFVHEDVGSVEIVLEGEPEIYMVSSLSEEGLDESHSFMVMNEEVTTVHVPGIYRFSHVELEIASLRTIRREEADVDIAEAHKRLEIVADPDRFSVSVRLDRTRFRPLDHDDRRVLFEPPVEEPDEDEDEE